MDRKTIFILVICVTLVLFWGRLADRLFPRKPLPPSTNQVSLVTGTNTNTNATLQGRPAATWSAATNTLSGTNGLPLTQPGAPEQLLVLTNNNASYTFTSRGGGLKTVELRHYPETIDCGRDLPGEHRWAALNKGAPVPALSIIGNDAWQGDGLFQLVKTPEGVRAQKQLPSGVVLIKDFSLGSNYLVYCTVKLENRSAAPVVLPPAEWVIGTATPMGIKDLGHTMGAYWYDGQTVHSVDAAYFDNRTLGCIPGTPLHLYQAGHSNVVWAAVHNQFFAMAAVSREPADQVLVRKIDLPAPSLEMIATNRGAVTHPFGFQTALVFPNTQVPANQTLQRQFTVYAGPKEYNVLAKLGLEMKNNLDAIMGFGGFRGFFAKPLLLAMNWLHGLGLHYALAIICITVVIKLLFWPLTTASTRSMKRMQALQPQMKAIQEKYKDDPAKMNAKTMEFMRENKVSPLGGCLPMLLQIPVFLGFYTMLQSAIELRGVRFLWACDLSQADTVAFIPGLGWPINPLPILMGITMLYQARLTPPSPGMDPAQQKIMKYMPLMFIAFLYNMSAGLTLYWTVQNILTIVQMKLTKTEDPGAGGKAVAVPVRKK